MCKKMYIGYFIISLIFYEKILLTLTLRNSLWYYYHGGKRDDDSK